MSEIRIYSKFGEKVADPFKINRVYPEEDSEDNTIINSPGQDGANKDTKATVGEQDSVSPESADKN